jgi:[ribosomal protein S18]-alanine N-acetyltransferase
VNLEFIPFKVEHLDDVLAIEQISFPQPWTRGMFERELSLPISHFIVASAGGTVIGYGGYWCIEDEAHLINLAVHPQSRSQGIGRRLLEHLLSMMSSHPGMRTILLEVRKSNRPAQHLYESCGFRVVGCRPHYYCTEDALLMQKDLHL